jgi:sporulation protein YlmC with PRC-barrel domain
MTSDHDPRDERGSESPSRRFLGSELIGRWVVDEDGQRLGRVVDLEVRPHDAFAIPSLVIGPSTFLARFSLVRRRARLTPTAVGGPERVVAWSAVRSVEDDRIVVGDEKPQRVAAKE